jgi:hypothetical protein
MLVVLLVLSTIGWYAPKANAEPHSGHGYRGGHHRSHGHGHHGHHRSHGYHAHGHSHYYVPYYRPYYRPYVAPYYVAPAPYYVQPAPYNGVEFYGERGGFSLFW